MGEMHEERGGDVMPPPGVRPSVNVHSALPTLFFGFSWRLHSRGMSDEVIVTTDRTFPDSGSSVGTLRRNRTSGAGPSTRVCSA